MRLQIALGMALVLVSPAMASADSRVSTWTTYYGDDNGVAVVSPSITLTTSIADTVDIEAGYDVDVITGASLDVVTRATRSDWSDVRHGFIIGADWRFAPGFSIGARYLPSFESDYVSHGFAASASGEWLDRRLTTALSFRHTRDKTRNVELLDWRTLRTWLGGIEQRFVLDRRTVASLAYELQHIAGYQGSPYRWVRIRIYDILEGNGEAILPERPPTSRLRHAIGVSIRRALTARLFAHGSYRFYIDTWKTRSHTAELALRHAFLGTRFSVEVYGRFYLQSAAEFYASSYEASWTSLPRNHTADKLLGPHWALSFGARTDLRLAMAGGGAELTVTPKLEYYEQRFLDNAFLTRRGAVIASVGVGVEF